MTAPTARRAALALALSMAAGVLVVCGDDAPDATRANATTSTAHGRASAVARVHAASR